MQLLEDVRILEALALDGSHTSVGPCTTRMRTSHAHVQGRLPAESGRCENISRAESWTRRDKPTNFGRSRSIAEASETLYDTTDSVVPASALAWCTDEGMHPARIETTPTPGAFLPWLGDVGTDT